MAKTYKLWIEIEEYDDETDTYMDVTSGEVPYREPVSLGTFPTLAQAADAAETLVRYFSDAV